MKSEREPYPQIVRDLRRLAPSAIEGGHGFTGNRMEHAAREIMRLRSLLASCHTITYGDDGELQSAPDGMKNMIDFARDPIEKIEETLAQRSVAKMVEWAKANPEEAARLGFKVGAVNVAGDCKP